MASSPGLQLKARWFWLSIQTLLLALPTAPESTGSRSLLDVQKENAAYCATGNFTQLYDTIEQGLRPWRTEGITAELMDWMLADFAEYPIRNKGVAIAFKGGQPYIVTDRAILDKNKVGHHKYLITAHLALFAALSAAFGPAIPDVEFIVATADEPGSLLAKYDNGTHPSRLPLVLRFCRSAHSHADVLVPDIHFFTRNFTGRLLSAVADFNEKWPWAAKKAAMFGRFSPYVRAASQHAPELYRRGKGGKDICTPAAPDLWFCDVRKHFIWEYARGAKRAGLAIDVAQQPKRDMLHHASHKLLLHLDGQSCSSRLEQLLVLGSAVVKEESGYVAFFHHLIQPYRHYIPFWKQFPEEAKEAVAWVAAHDAEAAAMGAAAQAVAVRYLHKRALMCYWLRLMQEMAALMRYKPGPEGGARRYPFWIPVSSYMEEEGMAELAEHKLTNMEFWD